MDRSIGGGEQKRSYLLLVIYTMPFVPASQPHFDYYFLLGGDEDESAKRQFISHNLVNTISNHSPG